MQVWFVRHATAVDPEKFLGEDADRPLTKKGRKRFRLLAHSLAASAVPPQLILTSPLLRAVETAETLRKSAGLSKEQVLVENRLAPGLTAAKLISALGKQAQEVIAVVGHEPDFSACVSQLTGGSRIEMGKGFIACVEFEGPLKAKQGTLRWLIGPKLDAA